MKHSLKLFLSCFVLFCLNSCSNDDLTNETSQNEPQNAIYTKTNEGVIPFTVENVQNALTEVLRYYENERPSVAKHFSNYKVNTTHVYYRFIPQDSLQYVKLMEEDEALQLTTDPFEFTVKERVEDPGENEIPIFYAIVAVDTKIPDVPTEKIAELHFTDEDNLEDTPANYDEIEFKQNLMYEARKLARDLDDEEIKEGYMNYREGFEKNTSKKTTLGLFGKKWRPSGVLRVEDDWITERRNHLVTYPVINVRVNALKWGWLRIEHGYTNADGYFSTGTTYTKNVHYNVKFTDYVKVRVRPGNFFDIASWKSGNHKRRSLDVTFVNNTKHQFYALINNSAWDFFTRVVPTYGVYDPKAIEISGHYNDHKSNFWFGWVPFRSEVKIGGKYSDGNRRRSDALYAVVIHEITHKSHYKMDSQAFNSIAGNVAKHKKFLRESWADCVSTIATNDKYQQLFTQNSLGNYRASNSVAGQIDRLWNTRKQYERVSDMDEYSPALIDLIDNINQNELNDQLPIDRVSGYTLRQIQTALNGSHTIDAFGNKLKLLYNNPTEIFVDDVTTYSQTVIDNL